MFRDGGRAVGCLVMVFVFVFCGTRLFSLLPSTVPGLESGFINVECIKEKKAERRVWGRFYCSDRPSNERGLVQPHAPEALIIMLWW